MVYGMKRDLFDRLECSHHTQTYFPGLLFNLSKPPDVRKTNGSESVCVAIIEAGIDGLVLAKPLGSHDMWGT
ncbi:hypothetical protein FRC08_002178 [Ceratobasidium sp. 394]|nr:hypothetical protein FRC08_002178 [Ceratobasidium sp. 394]